MCFALLRRSKLTPEEITTLQKLYSPYAAWETEGNGNDTDYSELNMDYIYNKSAFDYIKHIDM